MLKLPNKVLIAIFCILLLFAAASVSAEDSEEIFVFEFDEVIIEDVPAVENTDIRPGTVTVFNREQIESSGARTVADVVEQAPGIIVSRQGGILEPQSVSIRGGTSEQVLILIDGNPADSLWTGGAEAGSIPIADIEQIEVIRGASTAIYGEGAFSGVINIILKDTDEDSLSGGMEYGFASYNTHQLNFNIGGPLGEDSGLSAELSAGGLYTGGGYKYEAAGEQLERINNDGWAADASVSVAGNCFSAGAGFYALKRGTPGLMEFLTPTARIQNMKGSAGLSLNLETNTAGSINASADYSYNFSSYSNPDDEINDSNDNNSVAIKGGWLSDFEAGDAYCEAQVSAGYALDSLFSTTLTDSSGSSVGGDAMQHSADIRSSLNLEYGRFDFTPAAAFDWACTEYSAAEASADYAFSWLASAGWSPYRSAVEEGPLYLKLNAGTAFKNPSFQDLFWPSGALAAGNPDLLPERSISFDGGIFFTLPPGKSVSAGIDAVGFYSRAEDLIQWLPSAGGVWRPVNIGIVSSSGIELSAALEFPEIHESITAGMSAVYNWLSCTDADPESVNFGGQLAYRPEHSGHISLKLSFDDFLTIDISGSYLGYRFTNNANTKYLDDVLLLGAAVNWDITEVFVLSAAVDNIFGRDYIDRLGYPVSGTECFIKGRLIL